MEYPENIFVKYPSGSHVQGIAIDRERRFLYISFTTALVKTDLQGNIVGSVTGLAGHLGCIAWHEGKIYGSLEYKSDAIGKGILKNLGRNMDLQDGFYMAIFDCDKITAEGMDAKTSGVMTAVYLDTVTRDYLAPGHRYGCSGIDGTTFAPAPGSPDGKEYLYVAYGIYSDVNRQDNDHQVLLQYDISGWAQYAQPLDQACMHRSGPAEADARFFVFTGNTRYGIQNLEYDPATRCAFAAVYRGEKPAYPNYPMYIFDWTKPPVPVPLQGLDEDGLCLSLKETGLRHEATGICGYDFPHGSTGIAVLEDGLFYVSHHTRLEDCFATNIRLCRHIPGKGFELARPACAG